MTELQPAHHAQLGCAYIDALLQLLERNHWRLSEILGIDRTISEHAERLGMDRPFERGVNFYPERNESETVLIMRDPLTSRAHSHVVCRFCFDTPSEDVPVNVSRPVPALDESGQGHFREFLIRLKREFHLRGEILSGTAAELGNAANTDPAAAVEFVVPDDRATDDHAPLTNADQLTLCTLASLDPSVLASADRIAEAMDVNKALSTRTILTSIQKLKQLGLAERPEGERLGARLTRKGRKMAAKMPKIAD